MHINFLLILLNARVYVSFSLSFESQTLGRQAAAAALVAMNHAADRDSRSAAAAAESLVSQSAKVPQLLSSSLAPVTRGGRKEDQARKESRGEQRKKQRRSRDTKDAREARTQDGGWIQVARFEGRLSLLTPASLASLCLSPSSLALSPLACSRKHGSRSRNSIPAQVSPREKRWRAKGEERRERVRG